MLELLVIVFAVVAFYYASLRFDAGAQRAAMGGAKGPSQMARMIEFADRLYAERKWLAAEKAYLEVLKRDHKNLVAYSHLGVIYSAQKNYADAIECFKIAASLGSSATTWQNLGLAYYENTDYAQAAAAFEKAIIAEPSAQRYLAVGRAYKQLGDIPHMIPALERAGELDPSVKVLQALFDGYKAAGDKVKAAEVYYRLRDMLGSEPKDLLKRHPVRNI